MSKQKHIVGIFDSGVGGFSVLKEIKKNHNIDIFYFGDCARAPYGNRDVKEISSFIKEIILYLKSKGVTHFVSACNSMSVLMTEQLLKECKVEADLYIDMIQAFKNHFDLITNAKVLLIGTQATINSNVYQNFLKGKIDNIYEYIPHTLAGDIESNLDVSDLKNTIMPIIDYAKKIQATHIIYGCTHYPLVNDVFEECSKDLDYKLEFVDPAKYVSKAINDWSISGENNILFETSKETLPFKKYCESFYKN